MKTPQSIFITGVTGKQGGALAKQLVNKDLKIFGLTRNLNSDKAKKLKELGVILVEGNMDDPSSYGEHLAQSDAVFMVQAFEQGHENEVRQGKTFIDEIKKNNPGHLVYSSVMGADLGTGVPHFESKNVLEKHILESGVPFTVLRPASFYENFLNPSVDGRLRKGKLIMPLKKEVVQQLIGTDDIGIIAAQVIMSPERYEGKTLSIATEELKMTEMAEKFANVMGRPVVYGKLPGLLTRIFMGKDLYMMFKYMNKNDFREVEDISALKQEFQGLSNLESWIEKNYKNQA